MPPQLKIKQRVKSEELGGGVFKGSKLGERVSWDQWISD
jgi:hypothetical protein